MLEENYKCKILIKIRVRIFNTRLWKNTARVRTFIAGERNCIKIGSFTNNMLVWFVEETSQF